MVTPGLLLLMAKQPAPGQTKTRLMPTLSADQAAALSQCFLLDKLDQMRRVAGVMPAIAYFPETAQSFFAELAPDFRLYPQQGADLGQRLQHGLAQGLAEGYSAAVAIDSDTVTLPTLYLQQAFEALAAADVSLGPTEDGGYYAIGMKTLEPRLFEVAMSTPLVLAKTLHQAAAAGLTVHQLPRWYDVDTPADLQRLARDLRGQDTHTARYLRHIGLG